jgi:hypothetical protein
VQPAGYSDGIGSVGTVNGVVTGQNSSNDTISGIRILEPDSIALNYNFGESAPAEALHGGETATIGYWQNNNGRALLLSLNGGSCSTALGNWLATNFSNMYGANAGANNLAGKTNAQIVDFYSKLFSRSKKQFVQDGLGGPEKMDLQVLATAFAVYVTDSDLAGNVAARYGFEVDSKGTGGRTFNVGNNGAAFGLANGSETTIFNLLLAVNSRAYRGRLYDIDHDGDTTSTNEIAYRVMANVIFSAINETGDIV